MTVWVYCILCIYIYRIGWRWIILTCYSHMSCNVLNNKVSHIDSICRDPDQTFYWMDPNPESGSSRTSELVTCHVMCLTTKLAILIAYAGIRIRLFIGWIWILIPNSMSLQDFCYKKWHYTHTKNTNCSWQNPDPSNWFGSYMIRILIRQPKGMCCHICITNTVSTLWIISV